MMTKEEITKMVERNMKNNPNPMIDHETAMKALEIDLKTRRQEKHPCLYAIIAANK